MKDHGTENLEEVASELIAIDIVAQNFERESTLGSFLADYMKFMFGREGVINGFSNTSAEECHESIHGHGTCTPSMLRNNKCQCNAIYHIEIT